MRTVGKPRDLVDEMERLHKKFANPFHSGMDQQTGWYDMHDPSLRIEYITCAYCGFVDNHKVRNRCCPKCADKGVFFNEAGERFSDRACTQPIVDKAVESVDKVEDALNGELN